MNQNLNTLSTRVIFYQVRDANAKIHQLYQTTKAHFEKKEPFIIFVEDEKSQEFVCDLLWKYPPHSFLPHIVSDTFCNDLVAITKSKINVNNAKFAFNLCPTPLIIQADFKIIYDFEDLTSPSKNRLSALRFDAYKKAQHLIESRI